MRPLRQGSSRAARTDLYKWLARFRPRAIALIASADSIYSPGRAIMALLGLFFFVCLGAGL